METAGAGFPSWPWPLVGPGRARLRVTAAGGNTQRLDFEPGLVIWRDSVEHSREMLAGDAHVIGVEVKRTAKASGKPASRNSEKQTGGRTGRRQGPRRRKGRVAKAVLRRAKARRYRRVAGAAVRFLRIDRAR